MNMSRVVMFAVLAARGCTASAIVRVGIVEAGK